MKISDVKTFLVHDAERPGRNYTFVKIYTDEGLTGLGRGRCHLEGTGGARPGRDLPPHPR